MKSQKGFAHILILILLIAGIGIGLYLVQNPAIFKPKASENEPSPSPTLKPELVFVFTSESNSGGLACNCFATTEELEETSAVKILDNEKWVWNNLNIGFNSLVDHAEFSHPPFTSFKNANGEVIRGTAHGFELQLANAVRKHEFPNNDQVYLVKTGQGGSRISQWNVDSPYPYWQKFLNRVNSAKALLEPKPIQWIVWYSLGINDHIDGLPVSEFKAGTLAHVNKIKAALPGAIVIMTQFQEIKDKDFFDYNAALAEIANTEPNVYVVDTTGATQLTNDNYHWEYGSLKIIVSRMVNITKAALKIGTSLTAYPNPCALGTDYKCSSTLHWYYPDVNNLKITVKENQNSTIALGATGSQDISWITQAGATFEAYAGVNLLGSLNIKGTPPSPLPSSSNPIKNPDETPSGKISATPCIVALGQSRCTSTITWETKNAKEPVKVIIKETGGLFSQQPGGTQDFPWVSKIPLTMQVVQADSVTPLASIVVQSIPILTASPNPCTLNADQKCKTKLIWDAGNYPNFDIYLKENELVFYKGGSGSVDVDFITASGATFQARSNGQVLDSIFIKGAAPNF